VTALVVLAKSPRAGAVKTRLCPPLTGASAATFAAAALADTLDTADRISWSAKILALDLAAPQWQRPGWTHVQQRAGGLDQRIGHALVVAQQIAAGAPVLLIGMDTPHLRVADLQHARDLLAPYDTVLGPADDGGYWAIGLRRADARLIEGVPMSTGITGTAQLLRLTDAGLTVGFAARYRDIDTIDDAMAASRSLRHSRFAVALREAGA
jgi:uncharacterized protein